MTDKCVCGAKARKVKARLELFDGDVVLNDVDALYCPDCEEEVLTTGQAADARQRFKESLPGFTAFSIRKKITKVGNSLTIPLAKELADFMNLHKGEEVKITLKNKSRLIIDVA